MKWMNKIYKAKDDNTLEKWLSTNCNYSTDIFADPGYSDQYKSYFSYLFDDNTYIKGDIDFKLNPGFNELEFETEFETEYKMENDELRPYVDYVPSDYSRDEINKIVNIYNYDEKRQMSETLSKIAILIPPGSNQSNANYLFKNINEYIKEIEGFRIPHIRSHAKIVKIKKIKFNLTKVDIYNFVYSVSVINHNKRKTFNILNIDKINDPLKNITNESYSSTKKSEECSELNISINKLYNEIVRYHKYIKYIWYDIFVPFIDSNDCMTLEYLSNKDYWMFEEFMKEQTIYKVMTSSLDKLNQQSYQLSNK
jgi:hypothetical protein